ncbi:hypothetical protein FE391_07705 [Nonomuraea sp. KC401]|uniref:hypothetical protein n=1 Tax=unclassified Nonomuraea TaxID=2593643 RepID=UPI0010FE1B40|nr:MULTISPECIES: hypothetical protein [unclassified Nonomuraea]NBE93053.1 hypothetical protein [Nonomuraea sp. K271]TLF80386.1 hypothetical protein FE391_07705 [Nonomuraea sp. KC401]
MARQEECSSEGVDERDGGLLDLSAASLRDIAALSAEDPSVFGEAVKRALGQSGPLLGFGQSI